MQRVKVSFGSGLAWPYVEELVVEDFDCEQDIVGKLIDKLEEDGDTGVFIPEDEIQNYGDDEYVTGGNHCLHLRHYGQGVHITKLGDVDNDTDTDK